VNVIKETIKLEYEGIPVNVNVSPIKFKTSMVEKIAIIEYEVKLVISMPSKPSVRSTTITKGKILYRDGKIVTAQFHLSKKEFQLHGELLRQILSTVEFGSS
jgi:hypothetical protein